MRRQYREKADWPKETEQKLRREALKGAGPTQVRARITDNCKKENQDFVSLRDWEVTSMSGTWCKNLT